MANPILKSDLIEDGLQQELDKLLATMEKLVGGLNNLRGATMQQAQATMQDLSAMQDSAEAYAKASAQISAMEKALIEERKITEQLTADIKKLKEEKVKYGKATEDEKANVKSLYEEYKALAVEMRNGNTVTRDRIREIDMEKKSYNELYATYNAVKSVLNGMTKEERENTEAGKAMTDQALRIRETMNELQKATGNYTLQVGRYNAAFDKLRFSFTQILREAPSALNMEQFLLAISNNIPIFMDQAQAYIKGLQKDAEELTKKAKSGVQLTAEETDHLNIALNATANAGSKVAAVMKQMVRIGWINAITLAVTFLLRKLPDIVEFFKNIFKHVTLVSNEMNTLTAKAQVYSDVLKRTNDEIVKLDMIVERLKTIDKGTQEWKDAVAMVNDITKQNLDDVKTTKEEIEKVTEAYKEQAIQIATNDIIAEKIAKSRAQKALVKAAMEADTLEGAMELAGIKPDTKEGKKFVKAWNNYNSARPKEYTPNEDWLELPEIESDLQVPTTPVQLELPEPGDKERIKVENIVRSQYKDMMDEEAEKVLQQMIKPVKPLKKTPKGSTPSLKDVDFLERELLDKDAVIELESSFKRRLAMLVEQEEKERLVLKEKYEKESKDLEFNREKHLITEKEYQEQRKKLDDNYNDLIKTNYEGNFEKMGVIQRKYWNKRNELTEKENAKEEKKALEREKKAIKDLENEYASKYRVVQRRIKTVQQEIQQNKDLAFNISKAKEELAKLKEMEITAGEDATGYTERINKLTQQIEKWKKQMQFDKQLSNYGSVWDIFQRNGAFEASNGTMRGIAKNLLGDLADSLDDEQIEQVYDTWLKNTQKAATEWYNTTMGYINDLISAYVELANAKAEAAAEATEAAQEEYDKEKALLEAGYASRVEATWAEYQEKKAAQEKAEADAKAAAQAQKNLNEISTAGNMIVAASNIWKTFSAMGPLGMAAAAAAITAMFGAFIQSKIKAAEVSKYGDGGFEVLEGGSHASGHDIDLGVRNRRGRRMRAEGREGLGIFSRRAMEHYGANNIEAMVNSVNRLEFEGNAAKRMSLERSVGMQILSMPRTDLHRLESGMDKLVSYGARSIHHNPDGTVVETRKNARIVYHTMK